MKPRTVNEYRALLEWADWFLWLLRNHTPSQISQAIKAAHATLPGVRNG